MRFVDAHIHLSDPEYDHACKVDSIIEDAKRSNVVAIVSNSMNLQTSILSLQLAKEYAGLVYGAVGIHFWNIGNLSLNETRDTLRLISQHGTPNGGLVAVGMHAFHIF